jgi:RND family efflux transporter MFP subunit
VQSAQATLTLAQQPYTAQDLASAQDAVKTAQQQLALAEQPGSAQDIAKAQAAVQSAQAGLELAEQPGSPQDIASAQDAANQAQAAVTQAQAALGLAERPYTAEDVQQAKLAVQTAQQQLALAKTPYTKQDLAQAQAAVDQAQAAVDQARQNVAETTVLAPVSGVITAKNYDVGAQVGPQTAVATIASPQTDVEVSVPQSQMEGISVGKPAQITANGVQNGQPIAGKVTNVAPNANTTSRTFMVKVTPSVTVPGLSAGTFATVGITTVEHQNVLAVPSSAVVQRNGQNVVFVVSQGIAKQVPVQVGVSNGTLTEVDSGVASGAQVVTAGQDSLVDGDHVSIASNAG